MSHARRLYDQSNPKDIERHALKMLGHCLRDMISQEAAQDIEIKYSASRKGHLGELVEKVVFGLERSSASEPDFIKAHVELKTTPLKRCSKRKYVAKERLVLGMIDYGKVIDETWESSSFLNKNRLLLLMMYLYEDGLSILDYRFRIIRLLDLLTNLSSEDVHIIKEDWQTIINKIRQGKAHELSEGDTFYLGACTKSADSSRRRSQPMSPVLAKPRAFSFKQRYLNSLIQDELSGGPEALDSVVARGKSIERSVKDRFAPFIGMKTENIVKKVTPGINKRAKSFYADLARLIMGVRTKKIKEFEKADVMMKIVRLTKTGRPKESMSFPYMRYREIINEDWESSSFRDLLESKKFFFVVYQHVEDGSVVLRDVLFWNMPQVDIEGHVRKVWEETVKRIREGRADNLPGMAYDEVCHVRPHGRDSKDVSPTEYGALVKKQSFWLSSKYIKTQVV